MTLPKDFYLSRDHSDVELDDFQMYINNLMNQNRID